MNWSEMEANWDELKALVKGHWPELNDAVLDEVHGDRAQLARAIQRHNGLSATDAEIAICEFEADVRRPGAVK